MTAALSTADSFRIRAADATDRAYVLRSWFEGARQTRWAKDRGSYFFAEHGRILDSILDRATCRIAHVPSEPAAILGFVVLDVPDVLHWVHVRRHVRGQGIARALVWFTLEEGGSDVQCSHWLPLPPMEPKEGDWIPDPLRVPRNFRYNPYRLFPR